VLLAEFAGNNTCES